MNALLIKENRDFPPNQILSFQSPVFTESFDIISYIWSACTCHVLKLRVKINTKIEDVRLTERLKKYGNKKWSLNFQSHVIQFLARYLTLQEVHR